MCFIDELGFELGLTYHEVDELLNSCTTWEEIESCEEWLYE